MTQRQELYATLPTIGEGEVRLLRLQPGSSGVAIECELFVAPLSTKYEALSYTWNDCSSTKAAAPLRQDDEWEDVDDIADGLKEASLEDHQRVIVNNMGTSVMPNLHSALEHLRHPSETRTLWVDYLCINQESVEDRNTQVRRMDRIYRSANRVIVWLGPESENSSQAIGELLGLAANIHLSVIYPSSLEETRSRIRPLANMLNRAWFSRVWVVQEVALSKEAIVQLGDRTIPWEWFLRAARVYRDHMSCCAAVISPYNDMKEIDDFLALKNGLASVLALDGEALEDLSLHKALRLFYGRKASDPRDVVFGLLGLLKAEERLVNVNYSLSARDVYEDAAFQIIQSSKDLAVLIDIDEYAGEVETASWAPDWTTNAVFGLDLYELFTASGTLRSDVRRCSPHTIKSTGLIFDTVTKVVTDDDEEGELLTAYSRLKAWEALAEPGCEGPSPYSSGDERKDAFWQTILMGMSADRSRRVRTEDRETYLRWRKWLQLYEASPDRNGLLAASSRDPKLSNYNTMLSSYPQTRWFFLTEDGYFGLGPVEIEEGDAVCILAGGKVPFILRAIDETCSECKSDQLCYQLRGFAYVHGIMDGETVRGIEADEEEGIEFCLR